MAQATSLFKLIVIALFGSASCYQIVTDRNVLQITPTVGVNSRSRRYPRGSRQVMQPLLGWNGGQHVSSTSLYRENERSMGSEAIEKHVATSYALLWTPGFVAKFCITGSILLALHFLGKTEQIGVIVSRGWITSFSGTLPSSLGSAFQNLVLPLLSSSCCLLQLVINALVGAGGCAGFNTALGPVRPMFLATLVYLNFLSRPTIPKAAIRLLLALLPEIVDVWNRWLVFSWRNKLSQGRNTNTILATVEIEIPTMGCVACINKIDNSLRQSAPLNIIDASSRLDPNTVKGGRATVRITVDSLEQLDTVNQAILKTIDGAGFSGSRVVVCRTEDQLGTK